MPDINGNPLPGEPGYQGFSSLFSQAPQQSYVGQGNTTAMTNTDTSSMFSNFFNNPQGGVGWGTQAIGAATGLAQSYLGFQQLNMAKDQMAFQQNAWQEQFDIQKEEYDRRVSERNARVADNQSTSAANAGI